MKLNEALNYLIFFFQIQFLNLSLAYFLQRIRAIAIKPNNSAKWIECRVSWTNLIELFIAMIKTEDDGDIIFYSFDETFIQSFAIKLWTQLFQVLSDSLNLIWIEKPRNLSRADQTIHFFIKYIFA